MMRVLSRDPRALLAAPRPSPTASTGCTSSSSRVTMIMSTYVFAAAAWFTIRYHRSGAASSPSASPRPRRHETIVDRGSSRVLALVGHRLPAVRRACATPPKDADVVYVDAKQWMWKFAYPDGRDANDVLTVPVGRPVKLVMTSRDVIHSFYVPAFRVKKDVLPGRYTTLWFEATRAGHVSRSGAPSTAASSHSLMRGEVVRARRRRTTRAGKRSSRRRTRLADCGARPRLVRRRRSRLAGPRRRRARAVRRLPHARRPAARRPDVEPALSAPSASSPTGGA